MKLRRRRRRIEFWQARNGRWYWHEKVSGKVKADGSYALRRSLRRALLRMYPGEELHFVPELGRRRAV